MGYNYASQWSSYVQGSPAYNAKDIAESNTSFRKASDIVTSVVKPTARYDAESLPLNNWDPSHTGRNATASFSPREPSGSARCSEQGIHLD